MNIQTSSVDGPLELHSVHTEMLSVEQLSEGYLNDTLSIYNPDHRLVVEARAARGSVSAICRHVPYPFTVAGKIDYVTASMITLYVSQISYINARALISTLESDIARCVTDESFLEARDRGDLVFLRQENRFVRKIYVSGASFNIAQSMFNVRRKRSLVLVDYACSIDDGAAESRGIFAMPVMSLLYGKG